MGIQHLHKWIKENASECAKMYSLSEFSGKKIAIDVSIYMYKFASNDCLIENMYLMLSIFRYYEITPVFIFDGKPPPEKKELLEKRKINKKVAETEYHRLQQLLVQENTTENEHAILHTMETLKRKFIRIKQSDIEKVKQLIRCYGATYYDAPGEADALCAFLVLKNQVWACLSEDMDMFVYGCPRVFRYFSILQRSVVLYDLSSILMQVGMTQKELRQVCVLSGTDYNCKEPAISLHASLKYLKQYKALNVSLDFYEWMIQTHPKVIPDYDGLMKIYHMFEVENHSSMYDVFTHLPITNGKILKPELIQILKEDGFIFPLSNKK